MTNGPSHVVPGHGCVVRGLDDVGRQRHDHLHGRLACRQGCAPGPGSEAMQHAPWSFVPTVPVPIWLVLHAIIAVRLRRAKLGQAAIFGRDNGTQPARR